MKKLVIILVVIGIVSWIIVGRSQQKNLIENYTTCPNCHSDSIAKIVYGLIKDEELENWDSVVDENHKRRQVLGGCIVEPQKYYCFKCGHRW